MSGAEASQESQQPPDTELGEGASPGCSKQQDDDWRSIALLSLAWACAFSTVTSSIATIVLVGQPLAPVAALETLPLACLFYATGLANAALPLEFRRLGRRGAYLLGAAIGMVGGAVVALAIYAESFGLVCAGGALLGVAMAHAQNYRFAAVLLAQSNPPKAISWVLAGGVLGSVLGPGALARARYLLPRKYAGIYMLAACMHAVAAGLLCLVRFPAAAPADAAGAERPRPLREIFAQPRCWAATVAVVSAYMVMMVIMAPTPVVMSRDFGHSFDEATIVMGVHMVLMFAPSPLAGACIARRGTASVLAAGCVIMVLAAAALLAGTSLPWFFAGLGLLGVGWNFLFMAGTAQLASSYNPVEGPKVQAANDALVFLASGTAGLASAGVVGGLGWAGTQVLAAATTAATAAVLASARASEAMVRQAKQPASSEL